MGPLADQTRVLLGNYNGIPTHTVSILEGMRKEFASDTIDYLQGTGFLSKETAPVPDDAADDRTASRAPRRPISSRTS